RFVSRDAGRASFQEAAALPETERVVREPARPAVRPVDGILLLARRVFELRHEEVVVVLAAAEAGGDRIAQRMALRADHAGPLRVERRGADDRAGARPAAGVLLQHVSVARTVATLARGSEVGPARGIRARRRGVVIVLAADVAADAMLVPLLDRVGVLFLGPDDV